MIWHDDGKKPPPARGELLLQRAPTKPKKRKREEADVGDSKLPPLP